MRTLPRLAAILAVSLAAAASACSSNEREQSAPPSTTSSPASTTTSAQNPADKIAEQFAAGAVTWDTTSDKNETDALLRMAELCTDELAATFVAPEAGSGGYFNEAYAKQATSSPTITETTTAYQPPDTQTETYRAYTATWEWTATDGSTWEDPRTRTMYLTLTKQADDTWLVSTYDYQDGEG